MKIEVRLRRETDEPHSSILLSFLVQNQSAFANHYLKSIYCSAHCQLLSVIQTLIKSFSMVLRFLLWAFAWSATFSWVQASDPVHVGTFTCPLPSEPPLVIDTSHLSHTETSRIILQLAVGAPHTLCTLVEQAPPARPNTNHLLKPYGRSYNHHAWEAYANHWASFECSLSFCTVELPLPPTTEHVYLLSTSERTLSPTNFAARFLEKTTFGPTLAEIAAFDAPQAYVQEQLELSTVTSLRQFWRARIGHWHTTTGGHGQLAAHPCRATARYRSYAFIDLDERRIVTIAHYHAEVVLSVDGLARTVVPNVTLRDTGDELPDGRYEHVKNFGDSVKSMLTFSLFCLQLRNLRCGRRYRQSLALSTRRPKLRRCRLWEFSWGKSTRSL